MKKYLYILSIVSFVSCISGCLFFNTTKDVDMKSFDITQGKISSYDDVIEFIPLSVADIKQREKEITEQALNELELFVQQDRSIMTKESVLYHFDSIVRAVGSLASSIQIVEMTNPDKDIREAAHDVSIRTQELYIEHFDNKLVYQVFKDFEEKKELVAQLDDEEKYALDEQMKEFKLSGLMLKDEDFKAFKELQKRKVSLEAAFDTNINIDSSNIVCDKAELVGMNESFVDALKKNEEGKYIVRADGPTKEELLSYCIIAETREKFWKMSMNRAYPENVSILEELLSVRYKIAKMLGYHNFAELSLSKKMAKTPARVRLFLKTVATVARKKSAIELDEWKQGVKGLVSFDSYKMMPWDLSFAKKAYERDHFNLDERDLRPYFSMQDTIDGIFKIYQDFLGLRFEVASAQGAWHEDVQLITVYEKDQQEPYGYIFLDLHPRESKYSHACHADIVKTTFLPDGSKGKSASAVIANFPKPTKEEPSLLTHNDAIIFFHEFGHAMHFVLGTTKLAGTAGTSVLWDFVEMPSQIFENWMWQSSMLKKISKHYQTGDSLPDELIDKMLAKKKYDAGYSFCRQLMLADFSLTLHELEKPNLNALLEKLHNRYTPEMSWKEENHFYTSFGHLTGYDAGYYGYLWSLLFSSDIFNELLKEDLSSEAGKRFIEMILSKGGSAHPDELLENYLGRKPSMEPFFKAYDLI